MIPDGMEYEGYKSKQDSRDLRVSIGFEVILGRLRAAEMSGI
jgi:hypothetical protein